MGMIEPAVSLAEAQAFLRLDSGEEEALLAGLTRSATALCEAFLGQALIERAFAVQLAASASWQRLPQAPVRSIDSVATISVDGSLTTLPADAFAVDVDSFGDGWVRTIAACSASRLQVTGVAGMAQGTNEVPEPIRQGILRLVAHLFNERDGPGGEPPAAVTALWRPYRRTRLA